MGNPVLDIIEQVPKSERLGIANELKNCNNTADAFAVADKHGIQITEEQFQAVKDFLKGGPSDAELREIVEAVVPKLMVGPTLGVLKAKLGL